jgi:UDP-3-O-[3-hydroxymyristoyl] glucosamine N-acyltransferase
VTHIGGFSLEELGVAIGGAVQGDGDVRIYGAANLEDAEPGTIVRVEHARYLEAAVAGPCTAILGSEALPAVAKPVIRVDNVRLAFIRCLELFDHEELPPPGVDRTAVLGEGASLGNGCSVGPLAVLGRRVTLGDRVVIHPHAVLGDDVEVGEDTIIFPHAVLYARTIVGARARIHAGAVIGADGFGYEWTGSRHQKKPHNGRVRIGDDVEVGANTTIDRATTGETVIGPGTKIDNLVQVGHNVHTGQHCLVVAQVGIAGSATLGNGVVLAGQAGVNPHVTVGDGTVVAGKTGVWGDQPPGARISGNPSRPHREEVRIQALLGRLPELLRRVREIERRLQASAPAGDSAAGPAAE